jgi:hypothetical protein
VRKFDDLEIHLLHQAIPSLDLPDLKFPADEIALRERAATIFYGSEVYPLGEIVTLYKLLGVIPSSLEERLSLVGA